MPKETTLSKTIRWGIYLVALVPLIIFSDYLSPFHFGKVVIFRAWSELLAVLYVVLVMRDRRWLPRATPLFWAVTGFTAVFGLTSFTGVNVYQSVMGTLERMGGWFTFIHYWLLFVIMISLLRTREEWLRLVKISVVVSLLSTLYGLLQKTDLSWIVGSGGRSRIFGTIGNTALFAGYEIVNIFLALWLTLRQSGGSRWFYGFTFGLDLIAVFSTAVRGSLLAVVIGLGVFAWLYGRISRSSSSQSGRFLSRVLWIGLILGIVVESLLVINRKSDFIQQNRYLNRVADISLSSATVSSRFWAWQAGLKGLTKNTKTFLVGWGPENFNIPFSINFNPKFYNGPGSETLFDRAHNMFIEVLVTMGVIGLLSYAAIFGVLGWMLWKILQRGKSSEDKLLAVILFSGTIAYMIHNSFIFDTSSNFLMFFFILGLSYWLNEKDRPVQTTPPKPVFGAVLVAGFLFALAAAVIYKTDIIPARANYATTRGIVAAWAHDNKTAINKFKLALSYNTFGEYEIRNRFAQYVFENLSAFTDPAEKEKLLLYTVEQLKQSIPVVDEDYLPYLYISRTYILLDKNKPNLGYDDLALQASQRAIEISPTFVRSYYEVAQVYLNKKKLSDAERYFQKAVDLNPTVGISWWYLGAVQIESGQTAKGLESIKQALANGYNYTKSENDLLRVLSIYTSAKDKDYAVIASVFVDLIKLSPKNPDYHSRLAATYAAMGKIDEAVAEARKAVELDPTFASEAKRFIESLGRKW